MHVIHYFHFQGNPKKRLKVSAAPSSPPSSDDDNDSDWEPEKENSRKPGKKQPAARAAKGRGAGKLKICMLSQSISNNDSNLYE